MVFTTRRNEMIQKYVLDAGIADERVVKAMSKVPRHLFVEPAISHQAYEGTSLPIGYGQTISHPTTVALMSAALRLKGSEKVLEIGTGSGYQAAVLAEMGAKVYTIERVEELARRTQVLLERLKYFTIAVKIGDGSLGWNAHAPYDRIIVTAGAPVIPENLIGQLREDGILIIPIIGNGEQKLKVIFRTENELQVKETDWREFVPLVSKKGLSF
jgi:protein-L-isoaspartate(D-aspartate) O-methyltransferase